ncbi:MAG: hypothetical protein K1060chlam1_00032 [Candidatus Anoxychlamydiales bacterium]|nr:hypothetical protein [Candidatus Anoxychlamydiales bacterium]
MKFLKIPLKILFLLTFIAILSKSWVSYSSSFRLDKIEPKEFFDNFFEIKISEIEISQIKIHENKDLAKMLNQKYKFLSKGRQSFVFASQDNKYVLKLFRFHRYRSSIFNELISSFDLAKKYTKKIQDEKDELYLKTMNSYKLVYENLKDETATIYIHLNKTNNLNRKLKIEDKFKKTHIIDLNEVGFVLQKKAVPFKEALLNAKNDKKAIENLIDSFFNNLKVIYSKNLLNKDRHVIQNLGVIDKNRVVEVDIGRFSLKKDFNNTKVKKEAYHYTTYLKKWLLKNIPASIKFVDEKLIELTNNTNIKSNEESHASKY